MQNPKVEVKNSFGNDLFLATTLVLLVLFSRGCDNHASTYDEWMKAKYGHVVEGVGYERLVGDEPEIESDIEANDANP